MLDSVKPYAKAIVAFFAPGAVAIGAAMLDSSPGGQAITLAEWVGALVLCVVTAAGVFAVPNTPVPVGAPEDDQDEHGDGTGPAVG
jgi:hypothetical protein